MPARSVSRVASTIAMAGPPDAREVEDLAPVEGRHATRRYRERGRGVLDDRRALDRVSGPHGLELEDLRLDEPVLRGASPVDGATSLRRWSARYLRQLR